MHKMKDGMGFRDVHLYNKALLAKQALRIHIFPSSLATSVLKGFYFTNNSFLQVKANSSSSYFRPSLLWDREIFLQGLQYKISNR